jgi:hypothetical protein
MRNKSLCLTLLLCLLGLVQRSGNAAVPTTAPRPTSGNAYVDPYNRMQVRLPNRPKTTNKVNTPPKLGKLKRLKVAKPVRKLTINKTTPQESCTFVIPNGANSPVKIAVNSGQYYFGGLTCLQNKLKKQTCDNCPPPLLPKIPPPDPAPLVKRAIDQIPKPIPVLSPPVDEYPDGMVLVGMPFYYAVPEDQWRTFVSLAVDETGTYHVRMDATPQTLALTTHEGTFSCKERGVTVRTALEDDANRDNPCRHIFTKTDPDHTNSPYTLTIGWRIVTTTDLPNYVPPAPYTYNTEFAGTLPITEVQPVITDIKFG